MFYSLKSIHFKYILSTPKKLNVLEKRLNIFLRELVRYNNNNNNNGDDDDVDDEGFIFIK